MSPQNLTNVYNQNPTLQSNYTLQQYLDLFGGSSTTPPATIQPVPTPNVPEKGIINQNINQYQSGGGGGGGGIPMVGSDGRIADFNEAITSRQERLNNPGTIQSFVNNFTGTGQSPAFGIAPTETTPGSLNTSMLSRGMLGQKDLRATSGIPLGISGMIARALPDNYYDKMTLGDQILTQSYMGYTDPNTNMANKDPFGINVRSGFGNYSEYADKTVNKLNDALVASAKKKGLSFDPVTGKVTGEQSIIDAWNELTKGLQTRRGYYTSVTNKKKDIIADLALIQKAKEEEKKQADIKAKADLKNLTSTASGGGGGGIAASGVTAAQAANMGGGSRQAKSGGQKAGGTGRTDGGWGWAKGGFVRGSYFNGGIVSLRRR